MKLAILGSRGIPANYGGFETFAEELAIRLVSKEIQVTVYCEKDATDQPAEYKGVHLKYIPVSQLGPMTTVLFDLRCLLDVRGKYDIVYMLGYGATPFCLIPRLLGSQVWLNVDGIEWARAKWSPFAKLYFKMMESFSTWIPNRIIADAEGIKKHYESRHRLSAKCSVIAYGAPILEKNPDETLLNDWGLSPGKYYLVVARLEPENHVREIIEGYLSSDTELPLLVVGDYKTETDYVKRLLKFQGEKVQFAGGVYDRTKLQALRFHTCAYFHGHSVGGTNPSLLEALGCGNLIIAHDNLYNREVCEGVGFYFKSSKDIPTILERVESLSVEARKELSDKARNRIRDKYNWDKIAQAYIDLIHTDL